MFKDDIRAWKRRDAPDQTWANFKTTFREAHLELRESAGTVGDELYHNITLL
jgi:hypothetical protein